MPRLKSRPLTAGSAPDELRNPEHRVWQSGRAAADWAREAGLGENDFRDTPPLSRHRDAAIMWARANGLTRDLANGAPWPDWGAMRAAGIPAESGKRLVERMEFDGVRVSE